MILRDSSHARSDFRAAPRASRRAPSNDYSSRVVQLSFMEWWELADSLVADCQDGGSRTTAEKRTIPAEWLQKQGPIGTPMLAAPTTPAVPVRKDERRSEKGMAASKTHAHTVARPEFASDGGSGPRLHTTRDSRGAGRTNETGWEALAPTRMSTP